MPLNQAMSPYALIVEGFRTQESRKRLPPLRKFYPQRPLNPRLVADAVFGQKFGHLSGSRLFLESHNTNHQMENGEINLLHTYDRGLPSDSNLLNDSLGKSNDMFDELLDLEEKFSD
ncbi:hypothetical protein [Treponema zioleckii]|uniref:hypothetical protein n=1 Tax=Treponema zioleckii TaxID=331680 RepID=UPI00168A4125|nr:hypothetical protein [Treponema zioleckii]